MHPLDRQLLVDRTYTKSEIIDELKREVAMRHKLFPAWCATGRIPLATAADRIHLLEMALNDLLELYQDELPAKPQQMALFPSEPVSQFRSYQ
ncbi:MAG: hypothetical protein H7237_03710 [Alkalinema sp. FL-bin-369]|nr:hypothetical protein [Leptolyngbyaceae cyanobacterium LF-bin-369]